MWTGFYFLNNSSFTLCYGLKLCIIRGLGALSDRFVPTVVLAFCYVSPQLIYNTMQYVNSYGGIKLEVVPKY